MSETIYGYMKKLTVEGDSYNVIRIGGETLEELVEKRAQYIKNGYEEATAAEWIENGGTPDEDESESEPIDDEDSSAVISEISPDIYASES